MIGGGVVVASIGIVLFAKVAAMPEVIKFGALFDENSHPEQTAFVNSIKMVNLDRMTLSRSRVSEVVATYPTDDSFKASRKLCELIKAGVAGIFGPVSPVSSNHVQSVTDTLHLPFMETRWEYNFKPSAFSISIHPHPSMLGQAFADFIRHVGWKSLVILYETEEGLVRLQEVLRLQNTFRADAIKVTSKQLTEGNHDYRPLLKEIKKSEETHIVLDCDFERIPGILEQANEIELLTDYHNYLVTSLDMDKINLEKYKDMNVNITGFRLVDPTSHVARHYLKKFPSRLKGREHPLYSSNALIYDAVQVLSKALNDLASMEDMQLQALDCNSVSEEGMGGRWQDGNRVRQYLSEVELMGLTGEIKLDVLGFRTSFHLDLIEKVRGRMRKTANWDTDIGLNFTLSEFEVNNMMVEKLANKTMRVVTTPNDPYVMEKEEAKLLNIETRNRLSFLERYEGFCVDLIKELAKVVKFKFKFQLQAEGSYGNKDPLTGQWTGMIKDLRTQKADMAVIDMSITSVRQTAVDFTMPYMNTGVGILYKKTPPPPPNLFSFIEPFSLDVWIYMTTAYLGASLTMFLLARLTPFEWENPHPCVEEPEELENELTLHNCFWHNWGSLMQQGSDIAPKAISTRMVAGMWWFFTLIMVSSYTANLAAFLTASKMSSPVNSAEDLAKQTKIKYGTYCCGSTRTFFRDSTIPTYKKLNAFMESTKPSVMTDGNKAGLDRVRKEEGSYAFFMEAASIEYNMQQYCDLRQLGGLLDSKGYGIALPKDSPYTRAISAGVLKLQEQGTLKKLKKKWWVKKHGDPCPGAAAGGNAQMDLGKLGGVFIVVVLGMIFACVIAIFEFAFLRRKLAVDENASLLHEMWEDLRFAVDWRSGDTKPIKPELVGSSSRLGSRSILSKSNDELNHKYGLIGEERRGSTILDAKSRKDSNYACFDDNVYGERV